MLMTAGGSSVTTTIIPSAVTKPPVTRPAGETFMPEPELAIVLAAMALSVIWALREDGQQVVDGPADDSRDTTHALQMTRGQMIDPERYANGGCRQYRLKVIRWFGAWLKRRHFPKNAQNDGQRPVGG